MCKLLRAHVKRKAAGDVSARPSMIIRLQLTELSEKNLHSADFKSMRQALYRERWKNTQNLKDLEKKPWMHYQPLGPV